MVIAGPLLIPSSPHGAYVSFAVLALLSAQALCDSASALYAQLLQIDGRFGRAAIQSALNGGLSALAILSLGPHIGIWAWPGGMLADSLWQAVYLRMSLKRSTLGATAPPVAFRHLLASFGPSIGLVSFTLLYGMTDRVTGLIAGAGTLALWTWALRLGNTASGLISAPVVTAVFSRSHAHGRREPHMYGIALLFSLSLAILAVVGYQIAGPDAVGFLFGGGRLSASQLHHLINLARLAILAGIPVSVFTVTSRACAARGDFRSSTGAFAIGAILYPAIIAATFGALQYLSLGVAYALASAVAATLSFGIVVRRGWLTVPKLSASRQGA
ncbi:MAG: lipid II flippase MurJ [Dehalococcoidia bacterium]